MENKAIKKKYLKQINPIKFNIPFASMLLPETGNIELYVG